MLKYVKIISMGAGSEVQGGAYVVHLHHLGILQ
jgi:hypothetical protein